MSKDFFQCKQFKVYHHRCAMKVGTDGLLLGALTETEAAERILDIGTGTGLIALMLAQRTEKICIDAVEIDQDAAGQATDNFRHSKWAERLCCFHTSVFDYEPSVKYDLIVSNPPYFIDSFKSASNNKKLARHEDKTFFERLSSKIKTLLSVQGKIWVILPVKEMNVFSRNMEKQEFCLHKNVEIKSFPNSETKRQIRCFSLQPIVSAVSDELVIYQEQGVYHPDYMLLAKPFLTVF